MLASGTSSSATTGSASSGLPSTIIFRVPTRPLRASGATSGSLRSRTGFIFCATPFGTVTSTSLGKPIFTVDCEPFQTSGVAIAWPFAYSLTVSKFWKPQFSSFWLSAVRLPSEVCAGQHRDQAALAGRAVRAVGRGDHAVAGGFGVAGLHAVDGRVQPQQAVAVLLGDLVIGEFLDRVDLVELGEVRITCEARIDRSRAVE
jgi:hypothetical protein